jgi:putative heme transporter
MAVAAQPGHSLKEAARYLIGIALGVIVLVLLVGKRGDLLAAWHQLVKANAGWVLAAIGAEGLSLLTYSLLQRYVLHLSGTRITLGPLFMLTLANDAIANTVPGEPAVSSAYRYRHYRRRGATGASAGWTIFTIIIAQAIGMSLLLLVGVVVALTGSAGGRNAAAALVGLVIVACAVAVLARRDLVLRLVAFLVKVVQRITGYPRGRVGARIEATLARMREIPLSAASTVSVVAIAAAVWCCDFLCLVCSFSAVHAPIPWSGVLLAYGVAQVVGSFPIVPGGIGVVEGSLAVILVAYGADRVPALSAALAFRMVNFWLAIAVGWMTVGLLAYQARRRTRRESMQEPPAAVP